MLFMPQNPYCTAKVAAKDAAGRCLSKVGSEFNHESECVACAK